jgi:[acyl-carrier-protein] S-malonyltransferase
MINNGITSFVELGAGKVLTGLNKRIDKDAQSIPVESPNAIEELLKILR